MAINYPLAPADFWENLRLMDRPVFVSQHNKSQSMSGGGDVLSSFRGQPKWSVNITLAGGRHDRNLVQESDIKHLISRDGTILAYDTHRPYPENDRNGWKLQNRTVTIKTKGSDNRSLSLQDLSPQFIVTKGDKYSVLYDTDKYFLFEVMETVQADGTGDTAEFEIWPYMPPGVSVADVVTMRKACGKFKVVANSYRPGSGVGNMSSGFGFSLISVP